MSTTTTRKIGDKVSVNLPKYPGVWTIKSQGPVNTVLIPAGGGRGLRVPHYLLTDPVDEDAAPQPTKIEWFSEGEIVRITYGKFAGIYVVISDKGADRVNVAKLGGDGGRYVRMPRTGLVKVDPKEILK